jgi:hypothetical protein
MEIIYKIPDYSLLEVIYRTSRGSARKDARSRRSSQVEYFDNDSEVTHVEGRQEDRILDLLYAPSELLMWWVPSLPLVDC